MPLSAGDKLGPYEILEPLGEGGMGQVWKARDTRLNRFVAIKTSHKRFSERFEREAQAIAALNHPHICSLYDVGPDYLVMEARRPDSRRPRRRASQGHHPSRPQTRQHYAGPERRKGSGLWLGEN
jgi:serine/threonine protein kinase